MAATRLDPTPRPGTGGEPLSAIIDIGSNSIRLVVYWGLVRTPHVLFNEKIMAGLGRGVAVDGRLSEDAMHIAEAGLARFAMLCADMRVASLRVVATAAVRDAVNRDVFLACVRARCGLEIEVLSGEDEARYAALGVLAGVPQADGVVGDLGGGSLELIRVAEGRLHERLSLPIGSLRLDAVRKQGAQALNACIAQALDQLDWAEAGQGKPFYMVGGSWRALAQLHMYLTDYPLPVIHEYRMPTDASTRLVRALAHMQPKTLKAVPNMSASRAPFLPGAAVLLREVTGKLGSSQLVASAYGLREGLFHERLPAEVRAEDPFIAAARAEGRRQGRFPEHGEALMAWMNGLFVPESPADARLRLAACLLSDVAWHAHPDFRAERGLDVALHGNWVDITAAERCMLAAALFACFGGGSSHPSLTMLHRLVDAASLARARAWGLALRLGQRLTGGTVEALQGGGLTRESGDLVLTLAAAHAPLHGEAVARRHKVLAQALDLSPRLRIR